MKRKVKSNSNFSTPSCKSSFSFRGNKKKKINSNNKIMTMEDENKALVD